MILYLNECTFNVPFHTKLTLWTALASVTFIYIESLHQSLPAPSPLPPPLISLPFPLSLVIELKPTDMHFIYNVHNHTMIRKSLLSTVF
jgi:hypothetical protein